MLFRSKFADKLESATIATIESGYMTKDLASLFKKDGVKVVELSTEEFLRKIQENMVHALD